MRYKIILILAVAIIGFGSWYMRRAELPSETPQPSSSVTTSSTPSPTPKPVISRKPTPTPTPGIIIRETKIIEVDIHDNAYNPLSVTVNPGDIVIFSNTDAVSHTVTADSGAFNSGSIAPNQQWTLETANLASGKYSFHCDVHDNMNGMIIIK